MTKPNGDPAVITQSVGIRKEPVVGGDIVVWQEVRRETRGSGGYDLYAYNLKTKEERKLTDKNDWYVNVTTDGRYVAWLDETTRQVYLYDWQTKQLSPIGKGNNPVVAKGKLAYEAYNEDKILLYQPLDSSTKTVLTMPNTHSLSGFQFNGDWLLYLHISQSMAYKQAKTQMDKAKALGLEKTEFWDAWLQKINN